MNTPDDLPEDDVTGAYRHASDADAGHPAPSTRAAILAEARAASLKRTPAANESNYAWRAVAGLAVLGVAVLLWRQADRHVAPDLTVTSPDHTEAEAELSVPPQVAADTAAAEEPAARAANEKAAAPALREREGNRDEEASATDHALVSASATAPASPTLERSSADATPALAAGALRQDASGYQDLLQREFPEIWSGEKAAITVWVETDAAGKVVRKGELSGTDKLESDAAGSPATWTLFQVKTASGSSLQLAVRKVD